MSHIVKRIEQLTFFRGKMIGESYFLPVRCFLKMAYPMKESSISSFEALQY
jgi:hypothetical protein